MKSNVVFSINEGKIKFLQVSLKPKKLVTALDVLNTSGEDDAGISQALSILIKHRRLILADSRVMVVIPRSRVILRTMVFPSQNPVEIRSMIDLQVGNKIPYSKEEVEIDFQILSKTADGYSRVAVVIIPQELAMRYWKIFSDAKIPVSAMTISSVGLWLLYQQQPDLTGKLGAIFDIDQDYSEICICAKGYWLNSREIPIGFRQMQESGYDEILRQWELTQINSTSEQLAEALDMVYLASTGNKATELSLEMAKTQNDLTIKELLLTQNLVLARSVKWPASMIDQGISMASLAGIALSQQMPPIDLTPASVRQDQAQREHKRQFILFFVWGIAALISLGLALGMGFFKKNVQLARLEEQLNAAKQDVSAIENKMKQIHDIEAKIKGRLIFAALSAEIDRLLPSQVYLVNFTVSNNNMLSFQGVSLNSLEINQFQNSMVSSPRFSNVSLDYVNKRVTQQGEVDYFKITCVLK